MGKTHQGRGKLVHQYVLGVYEFMQKLMERYPNLLIEGCSGGGGRFDAGMLYYQSQIWGSDNTDAIDRIGIQHGYSFGYPNVTVGSHVSAVPNHQNGRITPMLTRGYVAMSGSLGYELNPRALDEEEKEAVRRQIAFFKKHRRVILEGDVYRSNYDSSSLLAAWNYTKDSEAVLFVVSRGSRANRPLLYVPVRGLEEGAWYICNETGKTFSGKYLETVGVAISPYLQNYESLAYTFSKIEKYE